MNLKFELDLIYQNVYKLNESLSPEDFDLLKAGFEAGINEGIGKWLGKAAGWMADLPNKVVKSAKFIGNKASDLYNKGKEWAGKVIDKFKNWMSDTYTKIGEWVTDAGKWISEKYTLFVEKMGEAFSSMGKKLVEFWEATKDKSKAFWEATKNLFKKISDSIAKGYKSVKDKLSKMGTDITEWVKRNWVKLQEGLERAGDKFADLYRRALEAIKKGGAAAAKWIKIIALRMVIIPARKAIKWLKKVPALYREYMDKLNKFIDKEIHDFKLGFEDNAGRPWSREKGFINKVQYPEMKVDPLDPDPIVKYQDPLTTSGLLTSSGYATDKLVALATPGSKIADVQAGALALVSDPVFTKRYSNYNDKDLKASLRKEKFTQTAIDFIVRFWNTKNNKKSRMPIPGAAPGYNESFKYLKTFEGFKY